MIENISTEDPQREIDRRKEKQGLIKPTLIDNPDFTPLIEICQDLIDNLDENGFGDEPSYIYLTALEVCFGKNALNYFLS